MSDLVFAIGSRPTITPHDAETLARFLELAGNEQSVLLSEKIRLGNKRGEDIEVDRYDLQALFELFGKAPDLLEPEFGLRQLHAEVVAALRV